jgi:hypothetical protein
MLFAVLAAGMGWGQVAPAPPAPKPMTTPPPAAPVAPKAAPAPRPPVYLDEEDAFRLKQQAMEMAEQAQALKWSSDVDHLHFETDKFLRETETLRATALAKDLAFLPQAVGRAGNDDRFYEAGQRALDEGRWEEALENFNQVTARGGTRADAALYWKAYTLGKMGRRPDAEAAIAELRKSYANSRWQDEAKVLELELKQASGQRVTPESQSDEELKVLALNGLMRSDPDRALPILEKILKSGQSPKLKRNVIYVLAQSDAPRAQQLLEQVARGQGNPDLQIKAIQYMGERRRQSGPLMSEIYNGSQDLAVKRAALSALSSLRDKDRLLAIAKSEKNQDLRVSAIRSLSSIQAAQGDLWQMYQAETSPDVKRMILGSLPANGNADKLLEIAKSEKDASLRRYAIQNLMSQRPATSADALVAIYTNEQDANIKQSIIDGFYSQRNVTALVQLARNEKDLKIKGRLVNRLGDMKDPVATAYLEEILR